MSRGTMKDAFGAEVIVLGPLAMRRVDVHALLIEQGQSKRAADFFAFSPQRTVDQEPTSLNDGRAFFSDGGTNAR